MDWLDLFDCKILVTAIITTSLYDTHNIIPIIWKFEYVSNINQKKIEVIC